MSLNKHGLDVEALKKAVWDYRVKMTAGGWDSIGVQGVYREDGVEVLDAFVNFIEFDEIPIDGKNAKRCDRCGRVVCDYLSYPDDENYCRICADDLGLW